MKHKVKFPSVKKKKKELREELSEKGLTFSEAEKKLLEACEIAESMSLKGYQYIKPIIEGSKNQWKKEYNEDDLLKKWFGEAPNKKHVKTVSNRLLKICKRVDAGLTLKVRPQRDRTGSANNYGNNMSPRSFRIFPKAFNNDEDDLASLLIHELMHVWFQDQKYDGDIVYGEDLAVKLAKKYPKKARRSAENYQLYSLEVWNK